MSRIVSRDKELLPFRRSGLVWLGNDQLDLLRGKELIPGTAPSVIASQSVRLGACAHFRLSKVSFVLFD